MHMHNIGFLKYINQAPGLPAIKDKQSIIQACSPLMAKAVGPKVFVSLSMTRQGVSSIIFFIKNIPKKLKLYKSLAWQRASHGSV